MSSCLRVFVSSKPLLALLLALGFSFGSASPSSFLLPSAFAQSAGPEYVVQAGDTLFAIALRFGVTVDEILAVNPGLNPNALAIGQRIVIPGYEDLSGTLQFHQIEIGETLDSLARRFGVASADLMRINRIVHPKTIYLGQSIVYPANEAPAEATPRSRLRFLPSTGSLTGLAAAIGINPWTLASLNGLASPVLTLGGAPILVLDPAAPDTPTGLPAPFTSVTFDPPQVVQGETLVIRVETSEEVNLTGRFSRFGAVTPPADLSPLACLYPVRELRFATMDNTHYALQGVCALADPGTFEVRVEATDAAGDTAYFSQLIPIVAGNYAKEELIVPPETLDPANIQPEVEAVRAATRGFTTERLWDGVFQAPSQGEFRSYFGTRRSYNGGPFDSYHSGVDYSGQTGTPILAPAPGIVVLAEPDFKVYGGVTFIDHGWGVYSGYLHQSKIEVAVGDLVLTGQEIGQVGNTGRVTGPHLHWEIWVGGVPVNPLQWLERSFP